MKKPYGDGEGEEGAGDSKKENGHNDLDADANGEGRGDAHRSTNKSNFKTWCFSLRVEIENIWLSPSLLLLHSCQAKLLAMLHHLFTVPWDILKKPYEHSFQIFSDFCDGPSFNWF